MTKNTWMWMLTGMMLASAAIITISAVPVKEVEKPNDDEDESFAGA